MAQIQINEDEIGPDMDIHPGAFITLTVSDTGQGIPMDVKIKFYIHFLQQNREEKVLIWGFQLLTEL